MTTLKKTFYAPKIFISDIVGYEFLGKINSATWNTHRAIYYIDFQYVEHFSPSLCSQIGAIIEDLKNRNNTVYALHLPEFIYKIFINNGFFAVLSPGDDQETDIEFIKYKIFKLEDAVAFQSHVNNFLIGNPSFPTLSDRLRVKILKAILEIFDNAHLHGKCGFVHTCGHYLKEEGRLTFTMSDMGKTIRKNVNEFHGSGSSKTGKECIQWAVFHGNTTKVGIPGGIGITLIREFLQLNGGKLQICSSDGYWEEHGTRVLALDCSNRVLGTFVSFEFNLKDPKSYILTEEIDPSKIL